MTTIEQITTENTTVSSNDKTDILLEVKDLTTYFYTEFGVVKAVEGVSFHVNSGEVFGLVGESSCGKSTLGNCILRLLPISDGKICVSGKDIYSLKTKELMKFTTVKTQKTQKKFQACIYQVYDRNGR